MVGNIYKAHTQFSSSKYKFPRQTRFMNAVQIHALNHAIRRYLQTIPEAQIR